MTSAQDELKNIDETIFKLAKADMDVNEKEAALNAQIAALRLEIARLKDTRVAIRQARRQADHDKQSAERKYELEMKAKQIEEELSAKREMAEKLIKDAPWRDAAFDWQIDGALRLPERALLGDRRGMGKTLSAIIWRRVQNAKRTLVCLRKEVAYDFIKELNLREPGLFVYSLIASSPQERQIAAMLLNHHEEFVVVTNIESWRRDPEKTTKDIMRINYDAIILDEAHHIKNSGTGTAKGFFELSRNIPKILQLTGTPIKNRPQEMFSLLHALYPDLFPTERKFQFDYCTQIAQNRWVFSAEGLKALIKKIESFYIARSPEDIGRQVPPPRIITYELDLDAHPEQKRAYQIMTERSLAVLGDGTAIPIVSQLAIMTRQAQVASWPAGIVFNVKDEDGEVIDVIKFDVHQSVKMDWAEDLLKELTDEGERVVVFSRFKPAISELRDRLTAAGISVAVITGDEKSNTREIFDDFDLKTAPKNPKFQVLLATYQTVGESANFNAATHMVLYDRFWNPGNEDQAIGRIDRINSVVQATVHIPQIKDTIDMYMADLIDTKRTIVTDFKDASNMQASLTEHLKKSKEKMG
jgi:SNF2 family DNA or RNA helicase